MILALGFLSDLRRQTRGSVVIETAIIAPMLILLALGSFDVSKLVARQSELQTAAAEALAIVQAAVPQDADDRDEIADVLRASLNPGNSNPNVTVQVDEIYRCADGPFVTVNNCGTGVQVSNYIKITLTDTYTPNWTSFGVGSPINYRVVRMVQTA